MIPVAPQYFQLYPTLRCNQRCPFCFNTHARESDMSFDEALGVIATAEEHGVSEIDVMGGEPLLLPWMADFVRDALRKGIRVNLSTNGSIAITPEWLDGIDPAFCTLGISLEGSTPELHFRMTGSPHFGRAMENVGLLVAHGYSPVVKTVLTAATRTDIPSIVEHVRDAGVSRYALIHLDTLSPGQDVGSHPPSYPEFLAYWEALRGRYPGMEIMRVHASCFDSGTLPSGVRCAAGVRKIAVMPDGSAYPCNLFHHFPEFRLGNLFRDGLQDLWSNTKLDAFRKTSGNACTRIECTNRLHCTGGCPAHRYAHYRDLNGIDPRCACEMRD